MQEGQIVAARVIGKVSMTRNGVTSELHNGDKVSQSATVITAVESSVVLVFSNGATTQLGADTTLVIEEFMQDPFQGTLSPANLGAEPTTSHTKLRLNKGELTGKVSKLKHDRGSYYTIQTPVGAAGIRGTTFRIVFRPSGNGQAFAVFSLSTVEGNVNFRSGTTADQGQGPQGPTQPGAEGQPSGGVAVVGGQEVVVTVSIEVDPATGGIVVVSSPTITSTQPISIETQTLITQQAAALATAAAETTFTSSGASGTSTTSGTGSTGDSQKSGDAQDKSQSSGGTTSDSSSTTTSSGSSSSSGEGAGATTGSTGSTSGGESGGGAARISGSVSYVPPSPPPASNLPPLTPGAG